MFLKLNPNDEAIAEESPFSVDEVQYNLIHRISEGHDALCLKTPDGKMIFAQTPRNYGWLWISIEVTDRKVRLEELVSQLEGVSLPGITSDPDTAELFADIFGERYSGYFNNYMTMEAYHCPKVIKPSKLPGKLLKETEQNIDTIAAYLAGFMEDAFTVSVEPETQIGNAKSMIEAGGLYLWMVDGQPVSMANIAHRSPRHARINAVFTPQQHRKKGYASALVAEICSLLEGEKLVPMLYADVKNPTSNKIYQNIGFLKKGLIAELKYTTNEVEQ
jgi:uncharacterized protein